jgi:hypothetical protein
MKKPAPVKVKTTDGRIVTAISCSFGWVTDKQEYIHRSKGKLVKEKRNENVHSDPR